MKALTTAGCQQWKQKDGANGDDETLSQKSVSLERCINMPLQQHPAACGDFFGRH